MTEKLSIDRDALVAALSEAGLKANSDWCVACGAGAAYGPELPRAVERRLAEKPELLDELIDTRFVKDLAAAESDWCVACGAAAAVTPAERVSNPPEVSLPDDVIRELASRYIGK